MKNNHYLCSRNNSRTMDAKKLICYKMTDDDGFAPNPFFGVLTLATCKPAIRRSKNTKVGDWISGWTSRALNGTAIGSERLVYIARISKIIPIEDYWNDKEYENKKAKVNEKNDKTHYADYLGDNIYCKENGVFKQVTHNIHDEGEIQRDTGGNNVLICEEFYYFPVIKKYGKNGDHSLDVGNMRPKVNLGKGHRISFDENINKELIEHAKKEFGDRLREKGLSKEDYILDIRHVKLRTTK